VLKWVLLSRKVGVCKASGNQLPRFWKQTSPTTKPTAPRNKNNPLEGSGGGMSLELGKRLATGGKGWDAKKALPRVQVREERKKKGL